MTPPKVGSTVWKQELVAARADADAVIRLLERLGQVAQSDKTRAQILEGQVACYRLRDRVQTCLQIGRER